MEGENGDGIHEPYRGVVVIEYPQELGYSDVVAATASVEHHLFMLPDHRIVPCICNGLGDVDDGNVHHVLAGISRAVRNRERNAVFSGNNKRIFRDRAAQRYVIPVMVEFPRVVHDADVIRAAVSVQQDTVTRTNLSIASGVGHRRCCIADGDVQAVVLRVPAQVGHGEDHFTFTGLVEKMPGQDAEQHPVAAPVVKVPFIFLYPDVVAAKRGVEGDEGMLVHHDIGTCLYIRERSIVHRDVHDIGGGVPVVIRNSEHDRVPSGFLEREGR